jgi:hypothetical protein
METYERKSMPTIQIDVEIPDIPLSVKKDVGEDMLLCALSEWGGYDDNGVFQVTLSEDNMGYFVFDPDGGMTHPKFISYTAFFDEHLVLIWLAQIKNYRHDWIEFAFRSKDANYDEYDALTCDAVLQNMLYGEVVYG